MLESASGPDSLDGIYLTLGTSDADLGRLTQDPPQSVEDYFLYVSVQSSKGGNYHDVHHVVLSGNHNQRSGITTIDLAKPVLSKDIAFRQQFPRGVTLESNEADSPIGVSIIDPKGCRVAAFGVLGHHLISMGTKYKDALANVYSKLGGRFDPVETAKMAEYKRRQAING